MKEAFEIAEATAKRLKLDCIAVLAGNEVIGYRLRTKDKFREWRGFISANGQFCSRIFFRIIEEELMEELQRNRKGLAYPVKPFTLDEMKGTMAKINSTTVTNYFK